MNKSITEAIDFINCTGLKGAVLAIPFFVADKDVIALRDVPICKGLVLRRPSAEITARFSNAWLGSFEKHKCYLPFTRAPIVLVGPHWMLSRELAIQAIRSRNLPIYCKVNGAYQRLSLIRLILWRTGRNLLRRINERPLNHPLRQVVGIARKFPLLRTLWRRSFKLEKFSHLSSTTLAAARSSNADLAEELLYKELLSRAREYAESSDYQPVPGRVLLVNAGLAAGGAERQIVNTLIGLRDSGQCESVGLLAEYIAHAPHLDFFLRDLETAGIAVSQIEHVVSLSEESLFTVSPEVAELLMEISPSLTEEILNLVEAFRSKRPEVVHAWQDQTSIKVGIAAAIAGVPRTVLASRNVIPMNFTYYETYMRPAYRALAGLESVRFINNSDAGACDYTRWLDLPRERFNVVRNGVDLTSLRRSDLEDVGRYRDVLGIPRSARVVGSVFRFWAEKRPMLWLEAAVQIARRFSDVHFLIVGEGPLRPQMEKLIRHNGLTGRVHLPGATRDVVPAMSAMDLFLLTSEFEGTPNVVLEAQWLGMPIVATDSGGTQEAFAGGETGLLVEKPDPAEIARLVGLLLDDQSLMTSYAQKGKEFVANHFGLSPMIQQTLTLYGFGDHCYHSRDSQRSVVVESV